MDAVFTDTGNSKTSEPHILILKLTDKLDLRRDEKSIGLSNHSVYYTWKNMKSTYDNNKFKISAPIWNDKFELPDGSYSVSDILYHWENIDNPSVRIYVNKTENRITFKTKTGYYLEAMKLLGSMENKVTKEKNGKNVPHLEITKVVLVHCNIVNNDCQQDLRVLYAFVWNYFFKIILQFIKNSTNKFYPFENI